MNFARRFDPQWTTEVSALRVCLAKLAEQLEVAQGRQRSRPHAAQLDFEKCVEAIVLDLYRANQADRELEVGIAAGTSTLQATGNSRYGASFISARAFQAALKGLQNVGLVVRSTNFWNDPTGAKSKTSRYKATEELVQLLEAKGAFAGALKRRESAEGIHLKDTEKKLIEYGEVSFADEARKKLTSINTMLCEHWIDLALTDQELERWRTTTRGERDEEASQPFDFAARTLHRVFNNSDWQQGGRFYGAWWISAPKEARRYVLIDGKRTVEVDYSGLHAAMLYAEAGQPVPSDPYARCLTDPNDGTQRDLVKRTFNALLNAEGVYAVRALDGFRGSAKDWLQYKRHVASKFPEFGHHFGSGVGLRLQYKDSELAEQVLLKFGSEGHACLPVHDSFLVHYGLEDRLTSAMETAFRDAFATEISMKNKPGFGVLVSPSLEPISMDFAELSPSDDGYQTRYQQWLLSRELP